MRSHLAARSTRLVLAVTATVALAASLTACDSDDDTAAAGQSSAQPSSSTTGGTGAPAESSPGATKPTGSTSTTTGGSGGSGGSSEQSDVDDQPARELGDTCRTGDLDFSVTAGDGDYLVVTAKAQNHIACRLDSFAPQVVFNSSEMTTPYPAELMKLTPPDTIELTPTTAAYATLIPNTTQAEDVVTVVAAEISVGEGDSDPAFIELPGEYSVSESAITAWYPTPDAATPQAN